MSLFLVMVMLGVANWFATTLVVESEIFRPLREWVASRAVATGKNASRREAFWHKMAYLVGCHMCTGTWVALGMALFVNPVVSGGVFGYLLTALTIKGIGHLVLLLANMGNAAIERNRTQAVEAAVNSLPDVSELERMLHRVGAMKNPPKTRAADTDRNPDRGTMFGDMGRVKTDNSRSRFEPLPEDFNIPETKF